ncbi:MAG: AAA family ATPase [Gammaproteobacteria bacterium]|nr:AAA family ATPase [Gammaproteobacteria bacterium]
MGVAGSGKTTIGRAVAAVLGWTFYDGDDHHPPGNVAKMASGVPLTDEDRAPWLASLHDLISDSLRRGEPVVVACSALKAAYRDQLLEGTDAMVVYLRGDRHLIRHRMENRHGHYMDPGMLDSQLDALEEPDKAVVFDVAGSVDTIVDTVIAGIFSQLLPPAEGR